MLRDELVLKKRKFIFIIYLCVYVYLCECKYQQRPEEGI